MQLLNPNGVQLVTQTHFKRAADKRFGEPEELIEDSWEYCRNLKGIWSPCTNDYDEKFGKTFVRAAVSTGVWTHGGGVVTPEGKAKLVNGNDMHTDLCPPVICERADVNRLHIYHFRYGAGGIRQFHDLAPSHYHVLALTKKMTTKSASMRAILARTSCVDIDQNPHIRILVIVWRHTQQMCMDRHECTASHCEQGIVRVLPWDQGQLPGPPLG